MQAIIANLEQTEIVKRIVKDTIMSIYPQYYPKGAVDYFLSHHNDSRIKADISNQCVYLFEDNGILVGTCTLNTNEINRLFVLPIYQGRGYGNKIMDMMEQKLLTIYDEILVSASLPAQSMYRKRGYKETSYHKILTDNGDYLCYHIMKLQNDHSAARKAIEE